MPIRREFRQFYGREWRTITRPRILERAKHCCERCQKPNRATVETVKWSQRGSAGKKEYFMMWRYGVGYFWTTKNGSAAPSFPVLFLELANTIEVVLTVAHLNHTPGDDRDENLAALCQWCHLIHDLEHHQESRATRKDQARPLLAPAVVC